MGHSSSDRNIGRREMLRLTAAGLGGLALTACSTKPETSASSEVAPFKYSVAVGWLRDLASEPTPGDMWPCIRWDDKLLEDQLRFLEVQAGLGMTYNCAWGLFISRRWPVPFENIITQERAARLKTFVDEAHRRGVKILAGVGVYAWGFDEVIEKVPAVAAGGKQVMCAFSPEAWEWQKRVLDFHLDPLWGLDGVSLQSADLGRCECPKCSKLTPAEHHALLLRRCADHIHDNRPDWTIGQACWGLRVDQPSEFEHIRSISDKVDYIVEVSELSAEAGRRAEIISGLRCAFGSLGGVFLEPPQHWDRLRWFLPCGLGAARALSALARDGGQACEYFYRPFANPVEEVSWRTGARILQAPSTAPEQALSEAVAAVYGVTGQDLTSLCQWFARGEGAYFSRTDFKAGQGSISLEPLIWNESPSAPGPPVYLSRRLTPQARQDYAEELRKLKEEFMQFRIPDQELAGKTLRCIEGTLSDIAALG